MSSYPNRSNLPPVPPPPTLSGQHARPSRMAPELHPRRSMSMGIGHGGGRSRSRSRSRSPDDRRSRRGGGNSSSSGYSKDWDRDRRERGGSRSRRSPSPSYQNRKQKSSEMRPQESAPSAGTSTYKFQESSSSKRAVPAAAAATSERTVNRLPPKPEKEDVVRQIMTPDTVRIPRRETEGLRPIFDRDELREAILRRMKSGDNDENPGTEQRVVAIIREPVMQNMPNHFPLAHQEVIPILPMHMPMQMPMQLQNAQLQVMEERYAASGVTASGVTYSLKQIPEDRDRGRSRSGSRGRSRGDRRGNDGPLESHRSRGRQVSSRSRSRSKERVHRLPLPSTSTAAASRSTTSHQPDEAKNRKGLTPAARLLQKAYKNGYVLTLEQADVFKMLHEWRTDYGREFNERPETVLSDILMFKVSMTDLSNFDEVRGAIRSDWTTSEVFKTPLFQFLTERVLPNRSRNNEIMNYRSGNDEAMDCRRSGNNDATEAEQRCGIINETIECHNCAEQGHTAVQCAAPRNKDKVKKYQAAFYKRNPAMKAAENRRRQLNKRANKIAGRVPVAAVLKNKSPQKQGERVKRMCSF